MPGLARALCAITATSVAVLTLVPASGAAPRGAQPDACAIVTETELEPVAGYALDAGEEIVSTAKASGCLFASTDPAAGGDVGVLVTNTASGNAKKLFSVKTLDKTFGKSTKVVGLGTRSNFSFKKGRAAQAALLVVDGSTGVEITLRGAGTRDEALGETQAIATLVLTKLP